MVLLRQALIVVGLLGGLSGALHAEAPDPGLLLLEQKRQAQEAADIAQGSTGQIAESAPVGGVVAESPCFQIDTITLTGINTLPAAAFAPILGTFQGKCIGQISINNLLAQISAAYTDKGFITSRAYVPAQDISSGTLLIEVLEGKIESYIYQMTDTGGAVVAAPARKVRFAFPGQPDDVLQLRDIEHGLETMNRLPSSQANANLVAGEAPGTTRIVVTEVKDKTWRGSYGVESRDQTRAAGGPQFRLSLAADDLLQVNDMWSLSYSGARDSNALAFGVSVPWRKWLFAVEGSYSEELSPISTLSNLFSQTSSLSMTADRLIYRDARSKIYAYGVLSNYWNKRSINIVGLTPQHRSALRFGLRNEHRFDTWLISADTSVTFGTPFFGADRDIGALAPDVPRNAFTKLETRLTYIRAFKTGQQLSLIMSGQLASSPLFSNDQISLGGWESVRGYNGHSFSGDAGFWLRSEIGFKPIEIDFRGLGKGIDAKNLPNPFAKAQGGLRPFLFMDFGAVKSRASGQSATMISAGAGITSQIGKSSFNAALAVPLRNVNGQTSGAVQMLLGLNVSVF